MNIEWDPYYELPLPRRELPLTWAFDELAEELERLGVDVNVKMLGVPDAFPRGGWCMHYEGDVWVVYYAERGRRLRPAVFTSPFDAANYFLWLHIGEMKPAVRSAARFLGMPFTVGMPTTAP
ncbi:MULTISPECIES: hypothetical protein [Hydrogenophaga]|uniref:Uncharacterized protein n=1 Tax=Hydrogenophaga intermedia TaxID=65786 RepID=A0A1L1PU78_HYDIT|nr:MULTISPECIES: hypothetical protein [Hydrogenophaga]AOS80568.1 hypothetical protein Q5W_17140 [Hydrogenophaga sp. PBC]TMU78222.1 hypothetical protein FGJ01_02460 [Hydrogenophaga intermedia]CDN88865.1 hypothetical protein BN948_03301 [Hydrogenophaga intermedia]